MVPVAVCQQDGIQMRDALTQHLHTEIRTGIHKYCQASILYQCRRAEPFVMRVNAFAHIALTSYDWNSLGCSCPEKCESGLHNVTSTIFPARDSSHGLSTFI